MEDVTKPIANPELLQAIARMQTENSRASREAVLDLVITSARFLAPVTITPGPQAEDAAALGQGTAIQFQLLANQDNQPFFPAFTSWDELRKLCGPKNQQTLVLAFDDYAGMILKDVRAAGFVLDPFGACLSFDRDMVAHLTERKQNMP